MYSVNAEIDGYSVEIQEDFAENQSNPPEDDGRNRSPLPYRFTSASADDSNAALLEAIVPCPADEFSITSCHGTAEGELADADFGQAEMLLSTKLRRSVLAAVSRLYPGRVHLFNLIRRSESTGRAWFGCSGCDHIYRLARRGRHTDNDAADEAGDDQDLLQRGLGHPHLSSSSMVAPLVPTPSARATVTVEKGRVTADPDAGHCADCRPMSREEVVARQLDLDSRLQVRLGHKRPRQARRDASDAVDACSERMAADPEMVASMLRPFDDVARSLRRHANAEAATDQSDMAAFREDTSSQIADDMSTTASIAGANRSLASLMMAVENRHFDAQKIASLAKIDRSKKGSIDAAIVDLVSYINDQTDYFTSSSCSGRVLIVAKTCASQKQGCRWILVSHAPISLSQALCDSLEDNCDNPLTLKFEPFILHVQCRTLASARAFCQLAQQCGYRNSGISLSGAAKMTVAVRSTLCMEVPLGKAGMVMMDEAYLEFLLEEVRAKFKQNDRQRDRFSLAVMRSTLS